MFSNVGGYIKNNTLIARRTQIKMRSILKNSILLNYLPHKWMGNIIYLIFLSHQKIIDSVNCQELPIPDFYKHKLNCDEEN